MDTSRYAELFLTESREHLSAINHAMLELERSSGGADAVGALFRAVHTLKGMSATMGYVAVTDLTHELETLLERVRGGSLMVTATLMDVLFQAADALEHSVELAVSGRSEEADVTALVARLRAAASDGGVGVAAPSVVPGLLPNAGALATETVAAVSEHGWTVSALPGDGLHVRVRIAAGAPLPGVRAYLVVQKAKSLGDVVGLTPPIEALQADQFDREFAMRLVTLETGDDVARALRAAGDVEAVEVAAREVDSAPEATPVEARPQNAAIDATRGAATPLGVPAGDGGPNGGATVGGLAPQRHVRIDLRRLDSLMNLIGELVITRGRLTQLATSIADPALDETVAQASRLVSDLQEEIMTSRMVPVAQVFDRFPRLVRDAARTLGKEVEFQVDGQQIELDRSMLDEIGEPIVHLLRNAVDHGIEPADERERAGKPRAGRLVLSATRDRSAVLVRVTDDGRGIDRAKVLAKAIATGAVDSSRTDLTDDELVRLISRAGFSTADRVSDISGRGVGIDAVQTRVRALGGSLDIRSAPGEGTAVTLRLPLTLAIVRALLARIGDETYALAMTHVSETVELTATSRRTVRGREVLVLRDEVLPLYRLRDIVHATPPAEGAAADAVEALAQVVVLEVGERRAGLVVDELTGQQEIVVKQFDAVRDGLNAFSGATILGDGAPALIVDVSSLL
ncbi:MAG TPA: chemotaxis protein CheA [Gemmatimonadaceae bacterium]|nr:chemotaxis protein CheA [Gemmatimonadaceae bacterium]